MGPFWGCFQSMDIDFKRRLRSVAEGFHMHLNQKMNHIPHMKNGRTAIEAMLWAHDVISERGFGE